VPQRWFGSALRELPMKHFLLFYDFIPDYVERRAPLRAEHLRLARESQARGQLVLGGAFADPVDGAVIVFLAGDRSVVERFVDQDPYVRNGLVKAWRVREWTTVVGEGARTHVA